MEVDAAPASAPAKRKTVRLRFCPMSNDLLNPVVDPRTRKLMYHCRNCQYMEEAGTEDGDSCVYRNEIKHSKHKEHTIWIEDGRADPTLPRSKDHPCPQCDMKDAVWRSESTPEGMTLYFQCTNPDCGHKWKDSV